MSEEIPPKLGDLVYYYDDDKRVYAATVAFLHTEKQDAVSDRPICNLAILKHDGRVSAMQNIRPARMNGETWVLMNRWSYPDEIPKKYYDQSPDPFMRGRPIAEHHDMRIQ